MRNVTTWTNYAPGSEPSLFIAGRGFTGHSLSRRSFNEGGKHLPWFNLINMPARRSLGEGGNGRVYDPLAGQFLSPDNYVQIPDFTQNFNRYSYCLNNPLKYTDPSGEYSFLQWIVGGVIGGIANVIQNQDNIHNYKDWFVYYNIGNLAGSTGAATSYYGSYGLSYTKIGGALGGMLKGGPAGFVEEFISKSLNSLYESNSFGSSVGAGWDAGKEGFKWGTVLGGLGGGLDAAFNHRNFWNGAEIQDEVITPSQNLPGIGQRGDNNCVPAIGENVDASFGGNYTQEQLRNLPGLGGNPQTDPLDDLRFWNAYSKATGHKFMGDPYKYKSSVLDRILTAMKQGTTRVAITQNGSIGHEVIMSNIINRTSTFINGTSSSRLLYYVFNPSNGGSFQRISRSSILNATNIFYIFK